MSLIEFVNEQINPNDISKITNILETKKDNTIYYYYQIFTSGGIFKSRKYKKQIDAENNRNNLISNINTKLATSGTKVLISSNDTTAGYLNEKLVAGANITFSEGAETLTIASPTTHYFRFPAGTWNYPTSNPAPLDTDSGANGTIKRYLFDDSTEESIVNIIKVPNESNLTTLTVEFWGYAVTADGNEVQYKLYYSPIANNESWDQAFSSLASGDKVTSGSQDVLNKFTFSGTLSNLGINIDELLRIKFARISIDDGTPVTGDWGPVYVEIRIS